VDDGARARRIWGTLASMEWTDLDQAYLDIFGTHPDLSARPPTVTTMTTGTTEQRANEHSGLSELEQEILAFERSWWKHAGAKETAVRERWDISSTRYYQVLAVLIDKPEALAYDPMLVRRLQRLRDARAAQRSVRRLS